MPGKKSAGAPEPPYGCPLPGELNPGARKSLIWLRGEFLQPRRETARHAEQEGVALARAA
jgi:hypothetical protein